MADRYLFVGRRSKLIAVVVATLGFITGCSLGWNRSVNQKLVIPITMSVRQQNSGPNTSELKALIAKRNEIQKRVIARLAETEKARRLNWSVPVPFQGKTIRDVKCNTKHKVIALTFDDGPWQNTTSEILNVLRKNNVKATFFVVGRQVEKYPQLTRQIAANGHAIGNHTWSHQYHQYSQVTAAHELNHTAELVYQLTGIKTSLFRPPAGILNNGLATQAHQKKYAVIMWSVDSRDWRSGRTPTQALVNSLLKEAQPGGIVLFHDGGGDRAKTVQALPQLIAQLKKQGYKFVTVPELLDMGDKELKASKSKS